MASFSNTDALALQLEVVSPLLSKFFEVEDKLCSMFQKITPQDVSSRDFRLPIPMRPGGKFRRVSFEGGDYGRGSGPNYQVATFTPVETAIAVEWTKRVEYTTDNRTKAVANAVQKLVADAMLEYKVYHDKCLQSDGSGKLATCASSTTSGANTIITLAAPFGARLLRVGQTVQVFDSAMTTYRGTIVIDVVDYPNSKITTVTANLPAGFTVGSDVLAVENATESPVGSVTKPVFMNSLQNQHSNATTGTWLNLNRANFPEIITPYVDASSGPLTTTMPTILQAKIEQALGQDVWNGGKWFWYLSPEQHVSYVNLIQLISEVEMGSGNPSVDVVVQRKNNNKMAGIQMEPSINADPTRIDLIDGSNWVRGSYLEPQIINMAGQTKLPIRGASGGFGGAEIFYVGSAQNYACKNPRRGGYITSLAKPTGM